MERKPAQTPPKNVPSRPRARGLNMVSGPLFPGVFAFALPVILTGLLSLFYNAADLVVVGRYCGELSVAAVGATGAIINLMVNLFIGLSVTGDAPYLGSKTCKLL